MGADPFNALACVDGELMPAERAMVPATDDGLLRGDGVFEVVRVYAGRPFALDEHLLRLERSASSLRLPVDLAAVGVDAARILEAAGAMEGSLRIVLTRGGRRILLTEPLAPFAPTTRLASVTFSPTRVLDGIKSLSYAGNMLATRLAQERGYDEALLVTPHGRVLEAPTSSLVYVVDGEVRTPPLDDHILASITRAAVLRLTGGVEHPCALADLAGAQEAFLASTTREVQAVTAIDGMSFRDDGPVMADLRTGFRDHVASVLAAG